MFMPSRSYSAAVSLGQWAAVSADAELVSVLRMRDLVLIPNWMSALAKTQEHRVKIL